MQASKMLMQEQFPSFSLVLETENLANAALDGLTQALVSLVQQDLPLTAANEVLMIDSGNTPSQLLEQLCDRYPWLTVHPAPSTTGYYTAKMLGAALATGQIVVYCDSDCTYEPGWLRSLLQPFSDNSDIQIVAGETTTRGVGFYGTAMALTYIFPQYSGEHALSSRRAILFEQCCLSARLSAEAAHSNRAAVIPWQLCHPCAGITARRAYNLATASSQSDPCATQ